MTTTASTKPPRMAYLRTSSKRPQRCWVSTASCGATSSTRLPQLRARQHSAASVSGAGSWCSCCGCEGDFVAEGLEFGDEPLGFFGRVGAVGVEVGAEVG